MRVNYIVANYIGPLRTYSHYQKLFNKDPLYFFRKHLEFIKTVDSAYQVTATFVFNDDIDLKVRNELESIVQDNVEIIFRKNAGFSYGIWNDTIIKNLNHYDYFFLIEDDYLPCHVDFLDPFIKRIKNNVAFVCGLVDRASSEIFPGHVLVDDEPFLFPSISNGLISATACQKVYSKTGSVFKLNLNTDYWSAYTNQIYFCKPFTDMGYNIVDTLSEYSSPYNNANAKDLVIYGKGKPPLLSPIEIPHV
jgi:hypothetical protein